MDSTHGLSYTKADGVQCALFLTSVAKNSQFSTAQNSRFTRGITKILTINQNYVTAMYSTYNTEFMLVRYRITADSRAVVVHTCA
jgi:hypothetical protein